MKSRTFKRLPIDVNFGGFPVVHKRKRRKNPNRLLMALTLTVIVIITLYGKT